MDAYEREHFGYDEGAVAVSEATLALMATFPPNDKGPRRLMRRSALALMDDDLLGAFRYDAPTRVEQVLYRGAIKARAALLRHVPAREEPVYFEDLPQVRSYPDGYEIRRSDLRRHPDMTAGHGRDRPRGAGPVAGDRLRHGDRQRRAGRCGPPGRRSARPAAEHGPGLLVLLVTLLLASLVVLSVGQSEVALGFEISVLGLGLGVVTVVQAASGTTPGPRWRNALPMLPAAGLVVGGILLETDSAAGFTWTFAAIAVGLAVAVDRAWAMVTSGAG